MSFDQSLAFLFPWEGGYSNLAKDPGGATNKGILQPEYDRYRKSNGLPVQSVKFITNAEAGDIYKAEYWDLCHCGDLNPGLGNCVFDSAVNSGVGRGARWLQLAINQAAGRYMVAVDDKIGPATVTAAALFPADKLIDTMLALRLAFLKVARHPKTGALLWPTFGGGWADRINGVRAQSHKLAGLPIPTKPLIGAYTMASSPVPVASPINANPNLAAAVTAAVTPIKGIISSITGMFGSALFTGIGGAVATLAPNTTLSVLAVIGVIAGIVSLIAHAYAVITGLNATNNQTIAMAENMLSQIELALGGKPLVFDNSPNAAPAAA